MTDRPAVGCACGTDHGVSRRRVLAGGAAGAVALALPGCAENPATGRTSFTGFTDLDDDVRIGRREYPKLLEAFGGAYEDRRLQAYVDGILRRMVPYSEYPGLPYEITVANTPIVNAFALPGGKITLTRGLLALAQDEAEVAGVIAHEMGHVTARHAAERQGQSLIASLGAALLGIATGSSQIAELAATGAQAWLRTYSRDQEMEADMLGLRYMTRAGYDPDAVARFLTTLGEQARLDARMAGRDPSAVDGFNIMATHPRSVDRVRQAMELAETVSVPDPVRAREPFLSTIDGMLFGDDPSQGLIRGRSFVHPELRFAFEAPEGFQLVNSREKVVAQHPAGAAAIMDMHRGRDPMVHLRAWTRGAEAYAFERLSVNGLPAATAAVRLNGRGGGVQGQLVVLPAPQPGALLRFMFLAPPPAFARFNEAFRRMTYSVRHLSPEEAGRVEPLRLAVRPVQPGDTLAALAAGLPYGRWNPEWFRLLNREALADGLQVGDLVKTVRI